jgi:hypothetical protein
MKCFWQDYEQKSPNSIFLNINLISIDNLGDKYNSKQVKIFLVNEKTLK